MLLLVSRPAKLTHKVGGPSDAIVAPQLSVRVVFPPPSVCDPTKDTEPFDCPADAVLFNFTQNDASDDPNSKLVPYEPSSVAEISYSPDAVNTMALKLL